MAESRKEDRPPCEFRYELFGFGWAKLYMRINESEFQTDVSYTAGSIENIMLALYCMVPCEKLGEDDVFLPNGVKETDKGFRIFIDPESDDEYCLYLKALKEEPGQLSVVVISEESKVVFKETCSLNSFTYAVVKACDEMIKTYGLLGYSRTYCAFVDSHFNVSVLLMLKAYLMQAEGYNCVSDEKDIIKKSDYNTELSILAMEM